MLPVACRYCVDLTRVSALVSRATIFIGICHRCRGVKSQHKASLHEQTRLEVHCMTTTQPQHSGTLVT